jgi:hypothetical protein
MDDPFQYTKDEKVNLCMYQPQDHMKDTWHDAVREAMAQNPFYCHTVQGACNSEDKKPIANSW